MTYEDLLAKSIEKGGTTLIKHMKDVGDVAERILTDSMYDGRLEDFAEWTGLCKDETLKILKYLTAMHDIGKATPGLQEFFGLSLPDEYKDSTDPGPQYRHEHGSAKIVQMLWKSLGWNDATRRNCSAILRLHHQRKPGPEVLMHPLWKEMWAAIEEDIRKWSGVNEIDASKFANLDAFCTMAASLTIISDWIASSGDIDGAFESLKFGHQQDLATIDFETAFGKTPRTVQAEVIRQIESLDDMPLMVVVEAPPGEGKTELAVWLAHKMGEYWKKNGIYFGLPTAATSNQMVERMRKVYGDVVLHHSTAWLEGNKDVNAWLKPQKKGLFAEYGVGTVDQIMLSVLHVRYGVLRLLGLTNKVVIVDEIHAYDAYMTKIIRRLVEWCKELKIPMIMLSATLPSERKEALFEVSNSREEYPLITEIFEDRIEQIPISGVHKKLKFDISLTEGMPKIESHGKVCVLVNTVEKAQRIYQSLNAKNKMLFHSRFTTARRNEIERAVLKAFGASDEDCVLVATQVVEQSLDIDFDYLITEIAPIDLLIQRMGRVHRFDKPGRGEPKCTVFYEPDNGLRYGKSEFVYAKVFLERTEELLRGISEFHIPEEVRGSIETVYRNDSEEKYIEHLVEMKMLESEADLRAVSKPQGNSFGLGYHFDLSDDIEFTARTRLGEGYKLCIIPKELYQAVEKAGDHVSAELGQKVLEFGIPTIKKYKGFEDDLKGSGRLAGCTIRIGTGETPFDDSVSGEISVSRELGVMYGKNSLL